MPLAKKKRSTTHEKRQNHMLKTFAVILCAALLLLSVPFSVLAEGETSAAENDQTLEERVTEMLAQDRVHGELLVRFYGNVAHQTAENLLDKLTDDTAVVEQLSEKSEKYPDWPESFRISTADENCLICLWHLILVQRL